MSLQKVTPDAEARARKIKLLLFDVDGVLTDGIIWVVPVANGGGSATDPGASSPDGGFGLSSQTMAEAKGFSAHDGMGISLAKVAGLEIGFITKRVSEAVKVRACDLKIQHLYVGQQHKMQAVREIMAKTGYTLEEIAYVGDDIIDLPVMRQCGLAIAVANARWQVLETAHWVTASRGGHGAGRDAIEFILNAKQVLAATVEAYLDEENPVAVQSDIGTGNM